MFKKNFLKNDNLKCNLNQTDFIRDRIKIVEKYFPELGKAFYEYIDGNAKSRDCIDKVAVILSNYAKAENVTTRFKRQVNDFADVLLEIGTGKDAQVQTMESKVLEQLTEYDKLCGHVQTELKLSIIANEKERNWSRQLKRLKKNQPEDLQRIALTESEVLKARGESIRSSKNLEEQIDIFERWRLNAVKESLLAWTLTELQFHSKALQLFTNAYHIAADMDVNSDIQEFRNKLKSTEDTSGTESVRSSNFFFQFMSGSLQNKMDVTGNGIPHPCSSLNSPQSSYLSNSVQEE